jgi:hypothetical protein
LNGSDDEWSLPERMESIAFLALDLHERIAFNQALIEFFIDSRRRSPGWRLKEGGQVGQSLGINRIGFGSL